MEKESRIETARRYLNYVDIASIIAGGLLGLPGLAIGGVVGVALDQSVGKEATRWWKNRNNKKT